LFFLSSDQESKFLYKTKRQTHVRNNNMNISERKNTRKGQARMTLHGMASLGLAWLGVNINHKKRRRRCSIDHIGFGLDGIDSSHPFFLCSYSELDMGWSLDKRLRADSSDERDRLR
jgi:hypothetical protein